MDYYHTDFWRGRWESEGGGTLINQAIHTIDLANLFLGKPESLSGKVENRSLPKIEVEDFALGQVDYENRRIPEFAEIGEGNLNWEEIIKACVETDVRWYVVEQDSTCSDRGIFESIKISFDNMKLMGIE